MLCRGGEYTHEKGTHRGSCSFPVASSIAFGRYMREVKYTVETQTPVDALPLSFPGKVRYLR